MCANQNTVYKIIFKNNYIFKKFKNMDGLWTKPARTINRPIYNRFRTSSYLHELWSGPTH